MRRREFIMLLGGAAGWPLVARAERREPIRRVGVLLALAESDPEGQTRIALFRQELQKLGWTEGINIRIDVRGPGPDGLLIQRAAAELVDLTPDAIFIAGQPALDAMRQATHTIPVVFVQVTDPVASGSVASLARPGANLTGFANYDSIGSKWMELLKEVAPSIGRIVVILNPENASNVVVLRAITAAAASVGTELISAGVRDGAGIEGEIDGFARRAGGGMIVLASSTTDAHRDLIIALAARHRLPSIYPYRYFVVSGGLMSYGADNHDLYRRGASYVDRILRGEKPSDLPIQQPTKFELVINMKTAKALDLSVPPMLLGLADEVIE